ncbi:MAG: hypothetical protein IKE04_04655, partial [Oscillospiraceae bacterium]|nr:hypothetical protein [Oscillospiraceae bacterium]
QPKVEKRPLCPLAGFQECRGERCMIWDDDWRVCSLNNGSLYSMVRAAVCDAAVEIAVAASKETGIRQTVLSGGSFQNIYFMQRLPQRLRAAGLEVFCHRRVSCNDEGLSLGQLKIASARLKNDRSERF